MADRQVHVRRRKSARNLDPSDLWHPWRLRWTLIHMSFLFGELPNVERQIVGSNVRPSEVN